MARHIEYLNGGVWTALDPMLLKPGQLSSGRNFVYRSGSPAIYRAPGRDVFGAVSAAAVDVNGLRDAQFDEGDHILVAMASASYLTAIVSNTGTFGLLASGLPGVGMQLEAVQYRNRFYLLNGVAVTSDTIGSNRTLYASATGTGVPSSLRQHGMLPVIEKPYATATAATFSQTVTGYYEYWTTELAKVLQDGVYQNLESTYIGDPTTVFVSATGMSPVLQMPSIRNSITTHWRLYRSAKKDVETDILFPAGFMISEVSTAQGSITDTLTVSSTSFEYPANFNSGSDQFAQWTSATAMSASGGGFSEGHVGTFSPDDVFVSQGMYGFNFGGFVGTVRGIEVKFAAYISSGTAPVPLSVTIGRDRASDGGWQKRGNGAVPTGHEQSNRYWQYATRSVNIVSTAVGTPDTITLGDASDRWFPSWSKYPLNSTDFGPNFMVVLGLHHPVRSVSVDYVQVKVHYAATFDSTVQFPTVVYNFGDEVSQVGKNGLPPSSSTGDLFQDSLVVNDLADPSLIRYSYPGDPEAFPESYYLNFETRENDHVQMIRVVNNRLIVGLDSSLWRVNYLPSEKDATFDRGKATECISKSYGVINPMCCCTFSPDGPTEQLAFVSDQGVHYTDGYNFTTLTDGVDWRGQILSTSATSSAIALINDKENQILRFYFRNGDESAAEETYLCLPLCYGAGHWVNGQAKVAGILHMRNYHAATNGYASLKSVWNVPRDNGSVDFLFGYGGASASAGAGKVYRETGTTIPSYDGRMQFTTRRMYLAGLSKEWRLNEVYGYCGSYSAGTVVTYTAANSKTNDGGETTLGTKSITLTGQALHKVQFQQMCEGLRLLCIVTGTDYRQENLVLDGESFGLEDSGR